MNSTQTNRTASHYVKQVVRSKIFLWIAAFFVAVAVASAVVSTTISAVAAPAAGIKAAVDWFFDFITPGSDDEPDQSAKDSLLSCLSSTDPADYESVIASIPDQSDPHIAHGFILMSLIENQGLTPATPSTSATHSSARPSARATEDRASDTDDYEMFAQRWKDADAEILAPDDSATPTVKRLRPRDGSWPSVPPELQVIDPTMTDQVAEPYSADALAVLLILDRQGTVDLSEDDNFAASAALAQRCDVDE